MTSKLKVDEICAELAKRGLSTTGIKPTLVRRLDSAIRKEAKTQQSAAAVDASSYIRKRKRENDENKDEAKNGSDEIEAAKDLSKMTVKDLREVANGRGISAIGSKKELIDRLCQDSSDLPDVKDNTEEEVKKEKLVIATNNKDDAENGSDKIEAAKDFSKMTVKDLREVANGRGIAAIGSKKELIDRLRQDSNDLPDVKDNAEEVKKEKLVIATKKGAAVLDQFIPDNIKVSYHVLQEGDDIYDATLNQTNVGGNNNKFYIIQVLEADEGGRYMVFYRWGRVGSNGQNKVTGPFAKDAAVSEFQSKFYEKTRNMWFDRCSFVAHPKYYTWLEMDYSKAGEDSAVHEASKMTIQPRETKLEARVAKFISLICNVSMMKQQMMEIGYNAEKLPLGKLSKATISKGYDVLKRIADVIGVSDRKMLEQLSGEFYTVIPHDFGYKKMREFVIDTPQKLKYKLEMVEALGEIEVATKLMEDDMMMQDPLYYQYERLHSRLTPIDADSAEFMMIETYMKNTHAKTHSSYSVDIVQAFRVSRESESECFGKFSTAKNRMLLWHGSRLSNWAGILSQGLRIAPPEAPVTGYMFGKGVYFADMFSKSANYCYSSRTSSDGVLLLCEVALGDMAELQCADYNADKLPKGKLSTKGVGTTEPDFSEAKTLEDGVIVPLGKPKEKHGMNGSLLYNEYIVYNVEQIRMRYVLQVKFVFNR